MKATIKKKIYYDVTINGKNYKGFEKVNEMAGMIHLKKDGQSVVLNKDGSSIIGAFSDIFNADEQELDIVKLSPSLIKGSEK